MDLQSHQYNIDSEEMLLMVLRSSLTFSHPPTLGVVQCFKSPIVVDSDSMDLQ